MRDGAHVAEATGLVDFDAYPPGTRLLVRREPLARIRALPMLAGTPAAP